MDIPILNIYYLLCYAWNKLEERDTVNVSAQDTTSVVDLLAKVLIEGMTYLFKKGLDRDYQRLEETGRRVKGKLLFAPCLKRNLFPKASACYEYDELSYDVLHNRLIKSTMGNLIKLRELDEGLRHSLVTLFRRFPPISDISGDVSHFRQIRLNRNNFFYDFVLKVCEIISGSLLVDEKTGDYKFKDFLRDESRMSVVFEAFVKNFYRKEQSEYTVSSENIDWYVEVAGEHDRYLPSMITDISLAAKDKTRKIVIDTKYYSGGFKKKSWLGTTEKLISSNLYQLFAYLKNLECHGGMNAGCEGILLYASVGEEADLHFSLPGHRFIVKTLDLNQDWKGIHKDLLALIA